MEDRQNAEEILNALFEQQNLGVLSTYNKEKEQPYASIIGFAASPDLTTLYFATPKATRKYANLKTTPRAAILIDSRSNKEGDFHEAAAVTATGTIAELCESETETFLKTFLMKHKHLEDFVKSPTTALMRLNVESYNLVSKFQHVRELKM